jgi:uncharacterized repeat protein (TIGR03803 family)
MTSKKILTLLIALLAATCAFLTAATPALAASNERVLHSFTDGAGGAIPMANLISDKAGNLYGTTFEDGVYNSGTVFELTKGANRAWTETVLYSFCSLSGCTDGAFPYYSNLVFDAAGNLYGTTFEGGASGTNCNGLGCGTVFELTPSMNGTWTETVLYSFSGGTDGKQPYYAPTIDAAGNLYGTTQTGGNLSTCDGFGCGLAFELTPGANGQWAETVIYNFCSASNCSDGADPSSGLIFDAHGNLYGNASGGGNGAGVVFRLARGNGQWTEQVLYSLCNVRDCTDGAVPLGGVIFDDAGSLFGTTWAGGEPKNRCSHQGGCGTVFELTPGTNGTWIETVLHVFQNDGEDGNTPWAGLILDAGNLYGTTTYGGTGTSGKCKSAGRVGCGTVFKLARGANGTWTEKVLHSFSDNHSDNHKDGHNPYAGLIVGASGKLYGTTTLGGANVSSCSGYGCGAVFEIAP